MFFLARYPSSFFDFIVQYNTNTSRCLLVRRRNSGRDGFKKESGKRFLLGCFMGFVLVKNSDVFPRPLSFFF